MSCSDGGYRRIPLPTYPFARERYWPPADGAATAVPAVPARAPAPGEPAPAGGAAPADAVLSSPPPAVADRSEDAIRDSLREWVAGILAIPGDRIDPDGALLDNGFDSINAVALSNRIRDVYGAQLPPRVIFETGSIRAMAQLIAAEPEPAPAAGAAGLAEPDAVPLSAGQRVLWAVQHIAPDGAAYNLPHAFRLRTAVDVGALDAALQGLVDRHRALRSTITIAGREPVQRTAPTRVSARRHDVRGRSDAQIAQLLDDLAHEPFDLERGPLLRVDLLTRADDDHVLLITVHHLVFDGTSLLVLLRELVALHLAARRGEPLALPQPAASYEDFVDWQQRYLAGDRGRADADYWRRRLADPAPPLQLPTDRPRAAAGRFLGAVHERRLPAGLTGAIGALGAAEGASPFVVMLSAFAALLRQWTGQADLMLGTPLQGRPESRFETVVGYFMNQVPIRVRAAGDEAFTELLQGVRTAVYDAFEHGDYPVSELGLGPAADVRVTFVFQNWLKDPQRSLRPGADVPDADLLALEPMLAIHQQGMFDLTLEVVRVDDAYTLLLLYNPDLFDERTVAALAERYERLVEAACADPRTPVAPPADGPAATEDEIRAIVTAAFEEALETDDIDPHDNFFDLGGHSVLLANVSLRLREALRREVQSVELFEHPTIDSLTRHLGPAAAGSPSLDRSRHKGQARRAALERLAVRA